MLKAGDALNGFPGELSQVGQHLHLVDVKALLDILGKRHIVPSLKKCRIVLDLGPKSCLTEELFPRFMGTTLLFGMIHSTKLLVRIYRTKLQYLFSQPGIYDGFIHRYKFMPFS